MRSAADNETERSHPAQGKPGAAVKDELTKKFAAQIPTLCVSLLRNDAELAVAVEEAGADGVKVHLNLEHPYAAVRLGAFEQEMDALREVIAAVSIPVGIVPRGEAGTSAEEVSTYAEFGFAFVDLYTSFMSPTLLAVPGIRKWAAPRAAYTPAMLEAISRLPDLDVLEASFLPAEAYGSPLSVDDLVHLDVALRAIGGRKPLVLPTDRALTERDLPPLLAIGVRNFLIGYAVTGMETNDVVAATRRFRSVLDG